ncbi:MAG: TraK protein [Candidatus Midichloriaceae bacterium]|jgi:hypothetical protein|nr:TraK protein [Candidatus Midichloriaceae bacterium]
MTNWSKVALLLIALMPPSVYAVQVKEIAADGEIEAFISMDELTRIKVFEDRIRSVKSNQGDVELFDDKELGEVYIRPSHRSNTPINIFVTTEKNYTYKLLLIPKKIPSEQLFLKNIEEDKKVVEKAEFYKQAAIGLIKSMRAKKGHFMRDTEEITEFEGNKFTIKAMYKSHSLLGKVLEFDNTDSQHVRLNPQMFITDRDQQVIAVSIDSLDVSPDTKTYIYIVERGQHERS